MLTCSIKVYEVELIVVSVIEELAPRAWTRDFIVPENTPVWQLAPSVGWNLLLLAHTEVLCTSRVGEGRRIPFLVPWDLERPKKNSTQKIQFTSPWLTGVRCLEMQICCCAVWRKEYIVQLHQSRLPLNPRDKGLRTHWITTDKLVVSRCLGWGNRLTVCRVKN